MAANRPLIAITMGEPGGIGGEISIQAWERRRELSSVFFLLDCPKRIQKLAASISKRCPVRIISEPDQAAEVFKTSLPIIPLSYQINTEPGTSNFSDAKAVLESIDRAVMFAKANKIDGMVTNPIQKETLYQSGFSYPGHTEYLAEIAGTGRSVMMIASQNLRVVSVTTHLPLRQAIKSLTMEEILYSARVTKEGLENMNPQKLFNYSLQCLETSMNVRILWDVLKLLRGKKGSISVIEEPDFFEDSDLLSSFDDLVLFIIELCCFLFPK